MEVTVDVGRVAKGFKAVDFARSAGLRASTGTPRVAKRSVPVAWSKKGARRIELSLVEVKRVP